MDTWVWDDSPIPEPKKTVPKGEAKKDEDEDDEDYITDDDEEAQAADQASDPDQTSDATPADVDAPTKTQD